MLGTGGRRGLHSDASRGRSAARSRSSRRDGSEWKRQDPVREADSKSPAPIEFINALRNTRVAPDLPAMGMDNARSQFQNQRNQSRNQHWEIEADFDPMLSQLLAQQAMSAMDFERRYRDNPSNVIPPEDTPLTKVQQLWGEIYPGRELHWRDWKPLVRNRTNGSLVEYTGTHMSDGEKAVLYLAGRVFCADPCVLVVDEPETHLHSLLAVKVWSALEDARPDMRFIYVTHDLTFALSRRRAQFVLASPITGLRAIKLEPALPEDVTEALLGSASLSFYASRIIFCEGDYTSLDYAFYAAWSNGLDTVVRPVGNCHKVIRCAEALANPGIASGLTALGIIDGDYHPNEYKSSLSAKITVLRAHEVESLLCLPSVVSAVCAHISRPFDEATYSAELAASVSDSQRHQIIIERWKRRMQPILEGLVSDVSTRNKPVDELIGDLPEIFNHEKWRFSPERLLEAEKVLVERATLSGSTIEFFDVTPGKQLLSVAAKYAGMTIPAYAELITSALANRDTGLAILDGKIETALRSYLPSRYASIQSLPVVV